MAKVAPLLAAGLSMRAISAETGISVGTVHRAKNPSERFGGNLGDELRSSGLWSMMHP